MASNKIEKGGKELQKKYNYSILTVAVSAAHSRATVLSLCLAIISQKKRDKPQVIKPFFIFNPSENDIYSTHEC